MPKWRWPKGASAGDIEFIIEHLEAELAAVERAGHGRAGDGGFY
jgi:hypothetical protein